MDSIGMNKTWSRNEHSHSGHEFWHRALIQQGSSSIWMILVCIVIALILSRKTQIARSDKSVPMIPYWLPIVGHIPRFAFEPDKLLRGARDSLSHGAFALNLGGTTHNLIFAPSLAQGIFSQRNSVIDYEAIVWWILRKVSGVPSRYKSNFDKASQALHEAVKVNLLREPEIGKITKMTVKNIERNMINFVSFVQSPIDQTPWEIHASAILCDEKPSALPTVEASLL